MHFHFTCVAFLAVFLGFGSSSPPPEVDLAYDEKVVGGYPIDIEEAPYQVSWQFNTSNKFIHGCGGSLISEKFVVSAAHCESLSEVQ